jgi:hypothetical protein
MTKAVFAAIVAQCDRFLPSEEQRGEAFEIITGYLVRLTQVYHTLARSLNMVRNRQFPNYDCSHRINRKNADFIYAPFGNASISTTRFICLDMHNFGACILKGMQSADGKYVNPTIIAVI